MEFHFTKPQTPRQIANYPKPDYRPELLSHANIDLAIRLTRLQISSNAMPDQGIGIRFQAESMLDVLIDKHSKVQHLSDRNDFCYKLAMQCGSPRIRIFDPATTVSAKPAVRLVA